MAALQASEKYSPAVAKAMAGTHTALYNIRVYYTHLLRFLTGLCLALNPNLYF